MKTMTGYPTEDTLRKEEALKQTIAGYGSLVLAFSGGVDSTYLADVASEVLGDHARLIIADSPSVPRSELAEAIGMAHKHGWRLDVIPTNEFQDPDYVRNDERRCYHCRVGLFTKMREYADEHGIAVIAYGANKDDTLDPTRVGALAAKEFSVAAPLQEADLTKDEVRALSRGRNLPTADKASFACLSTRFPTGTPLDEDNVNRVEQAEEILRTVGFHQYRVRHHDDLCRIEIDMADSEKILNPSIRERIVRGITELGYRYVTLDLAGYRAGSTALHPDGTDS